MDLSINIRRLHYCTFQHGFLIFAGKTALIPGDLQAKSLKIEHKKFVRSFLSFYHLN